MSIKVAAIQNSSQYQQFQKKDSSGQYFSEKFKEQVFIWPIFLIYFATFWANFSVNVHIAVDDTIFVECMAALCNKMITVQFMTNLARKSFKENAFPEEILDSPLEFLIPIVFEDKDPNSQNKYGIAEE